MSFWNEGDIPTMLAGLGGVTVTHGSETGLGLVDTTDEAIMQGLDASLIGRVITVLVQTNAFPTLKVSSAVQVDFPTAGTAYTVRDRLRVDDGALTRLLLLKG